MEPFPSAGSRHRVLDAPIVEPFPEHLRPAMFGMGCFWGVEKKFWQCDGVYTTMVGYAGGTTNAPTYEAVCMGHTGHAEVVRLLFDAARVAYRDLLRMFWEGHDPTQYMRQGPDVGSQYRSVIYHYDDEQKTLAEETCEAYGRRLDAHGYGAITTEIVPAPTFYYAEAYHQQYLAARPGGWCGGGGVGVRLDESRA